MMKTLELYFPIKGQKKKKKKKKKKKCVYVCI